MTTPEGPGMREAGGAHEAYLDRVAERLDRLRGQGDAIGEAAGLCADAIGGGGVAWVFGAGHSQIMALEAYPRIGGILGFVPMVELSLLYFSNVVGSGGLEQTIYLERVEGFAEAILRSHDPRPGDAMIIFSSSGIEVLPVEMARGARARGVKVVAVTSLDYSRAAAERRGLPRILADEADLVIDNGVPPGDAVVALDGLAHRTGPVSTILGVAVMNGVAVGTAELLTERGTAPWVFHSPHLEADGYDAYREALGRFRRLIARDPGQGGGHR